MDSCVILHFLTKLPLLLLSLVVILLCSHLPDWLESKQVMECTNVISGV